MGSGFIDSFQLLIGIYLLYMGLKGENLESRMSGVPDKNEVKEPKALRGLYIFGGITALSDFAVCYLRNSMFTVEQAGEDVAVTQKFVLSFLPSLTYDQLNTASRVLSLLSIAILIAASVWLFVLSSRFEKEHGGRG